MDGALQYLKTFQMADAELESYKLQLQQVEAALLGDPTNEELKKLKSDLDEVIQLQEDLTSAAPVSSGVASSSSGATKPKEVKRVWENGDRVMAPLPTGHKAVAVVETVTPAGVAITYVKSGQKTIVDPSELSVAPDALNKNYVFKTQPKSHSSNSKLSWHEERERRRLRAAKKEEKKKALETAKEQEKSSWHKFNSKATHKGMKGMKRLNATGSSKDGPTAGMKQQTIVSSRSNAFAFKSARGAMDSLF